jgi:hypothetical protein
VDFSALLGLLGPLSILCVLIVMGLLSRRLGEQTKAKPYYLGFFAAALLVALSIVAQFLDLLLHFPHAEADLLWIVINSGLPAIGVTIGVIFAWRYWSWLLAERD